MRRSDPGRGLVRCPGRGLVRRLGVAAAAVFVLAATSQQRAEALSLASPGTAPSAKHATDEMTIQVRGGHGHGGHGGGFRGGGGFHGGGGSAAVAQPFTAVVLEAAAPLSPVEPFAQLRFSAAAAPRFMAADLEAAAPSIAEPFVPRRCSGGGMRYSGIRYGGYRVAPHYRHHHRIHRRFYAPAYYDYPRYYFIRGVTAGWCGPITARARSAAIGRGCAITIGVTAYTTGYW